MPLIPHRRPRPSASAQRDTRVELFELGGVCSCMRSAGQPVRSDMVFLSCRRALPVHAIPGRPSSSLPPSFVRGRGTADFSPQGTATGGALHPLSMAATCGNHA